ncbi:CoA transferase [Leifsonia kafniensis]|uniref:CoA transferase n=1 Tax=Leifsonia kafniensis TaxID=475957 RepID=A0ABP7K1F9_9MICO
MVSEQNRAGSPADSTVIITEMLAQVLESTPDQVARDVSVTGRGSLPSVFPVTELATASIGAVGLAVSDLIAAVEGHHPAVTVDRRLASMWFASSLRPDGWQPPPPWDAIAGDYEAADGWIRLHTNAPAHREAALRVLGVPADRDRVADAVTGWTQDALEEAVVAAGGCAAAMHTLTEWQQGEVGRRVAAEPLIGWTDTGSAHTDTDTGAVAPASSRSSFDATRPLAGIRVLDLTRVLAGPIATRSLALLGADVLRIDPPWWEEPGVIPDVMLGKRSARLDLRDEHARQRLLTLLADCDVLVHGYRPGALDSLGLDAATRLATRPGLIEVGLDAYGWTSEWTARRGFDSLVQMSAGIADAGMRHLQRDKPTPLPVQALDHATGYLMAAAAVRGITRRLTEGIGSRASLSLARTAHVLTGFGIVGPQDAIDAERTDDVNPAIEHTEWGPARRLVVPLRIDGVRTSAPIPARRLGSDRPEW